MSSPTSKNTTTSIQMSLLLCAALVARTSGPTIRTARSVRSPLPAPASLDTQLENAVSNALWHPLDPEIIHEPPGLAEGTGAPR